MSFQCQGHSDLEIRVLELTSSGKAQGMFPLIFQGGSELHIRMGILNYCQVSSALRYDTWKCRRCDKILCIDAPQSMKAEQGVMVEMFYELL